MTTWEVLCVLDCGVGRRRVVVYMRVSASRAGLSLESNHLPSSSPYIFRLNREGFILVLIDVEFSIDHLEFWTR